MEFMSRTDPRMIPIPRRLPTLLLTLALCVSCGPQVIEGRPPFIGISALQLAGETLSVDFRISNQNGVAMNIETIDLTVTVNGASLVDERREAKLAIDANSAEEIQVEQLASPGNRGLLASLENRDIKSLPFTLQGSVRTLEDGYLRFEQNGHLYPVPGKPGFFRSAVTQAEQLRRENKL